MLCVLDFLYNSAESGGIVESQVGQDFAVDLDAGLVDEAHEFAVRKILETCGSVDTLNTERAEVTLVVLKVVVGIGKTFLPCVLGNSPDIAAATEISAGEFEDFLTTCA